MAEKWCAQFKLCRGCKFAGNECVIRDGETGNNSRFYDRMIAVINTHLLDK